MTGDGCVFIFLPRSVDRAPVQWKYVNSVYVVLHARLLFLPDGRKDCIRIVGNEEIKNVEPYSESRLLRGVTAIKITSKGKFQFD